MEDLVNRKGELSHISTCISALAVYRPTLKITFRLHFSGFSVERYTGDSTSVDFTICTCTGTSSECGPYSEACDRIRRPATVSEARIRRSADRIGRTTTVFGGPYSEECDRIRRRTATVFEGVRTVFGGLRPYSET
jgi:hypothetical protein